MQSYAFHSDPKPFTISFTGKEIADLNERLDKARWPEVDVVPEDTEEIKNPKEKPFGLGHGPSLPLMKELASEWRAYSWKDSETYINTFNHFKVAIEDLDIHFIHHRSDDPNAIPLVLMHGWPGSFLEFLGLIQLLTHSPSGTQAFHVVVPSQPGYAFSSSPPTSKWMMDDTARIVNKLMIGLGYNVYAAQGGDWGSITARCLGALYPGNCKAVHLNFCPAPAVGPLGLIPPRTLLAWLPRFLMSDVDKERTYRALEYRDKGSAYYSMQHLTPRTPAYALNDSPIGILAWLGEKMYSLVERAGKKPMPTLTRKSLYDTCTIYYLTNSIGTSFLPYALNPHFVTFLTSPKYFLPNFAFSLFPREIALSPERNVRATGNCGWYKEAEDGGHFAAWEVPAVFAKHLQESLPLIWKTGAKL